MIIVLYAIQHTMASRESLFSLELVIEKLYIPYETCHFPAVAFRLLDFPTILISHVETELADNIRSKIHRDPYYQVPNQFTELQDKHGNFMMKKGKSCLFKTSIDTLTMHLANTPLYIMVIDEYPEVPKLLGNSSLALNEVMSAIQFDVKKNGPTVPSVHGDKGLFKIFSLMGKEIGYLILGFRLLSLGPGLIAHLPESALVKRASKTKDLHEVKEIDQAHVPVKASGTDKKAFPQKSYVAIKDVANTTREIGSMTDVEKCDVLLQTVEIGEEKIHVAISERPKESKTIHTQTSRKPMQKPTQTVDHFMKSGSDSGDDDLLLKPNIICPPPLFYNSKADPTVKIDRDSTSIYSNDDVTVEDISDDECQQLEMKHTSVKKGIPTRMNADIPRLHDPHTIVLSNIVNAGNKTANTSAPVFPLLNALLTELSKIQNPQLVQQAMGQISPAIQTVHTVVSSKDTAINIPERKELSVVKEDESIVVNKDKKSYRIPASTSEGVPKNKGWMRRAPEVAVKKTKLVFGLTNTQRLRLAKGNPAWLKSAEHDEKVAKSLRKRPGSQKAKSDPEMETSNLSDTYTEMRRLAAAELEKTTMTETSIQAEMKLSENKIKKKLPKSRDNSPAKGKHTRVRSKSPKGKKAFKVSKPRQEINGKESSVLNTSELATEQPDSVAESVPSSRIEVRIPRVQTYDESFDSEDTISDSEYSDTNRKDTQSKFPGFHKGDDTLLDPIDGDANRSSSVTHDDESPLESTRMSKQFRPGVQPAGESLFRSTDDYDTKQFQSTDEPELQGLISEEERSEMPVPERSGSPARATSGIGNKARLSMKFEVVNPTASKNSPLPALRRSQIKLDSLNAPPTPTDTPRSRSSQGSSKQPTPRPRKPVREWKLDFKKESIHTESVSSYMPSESENILSLLSDGSYSDDFHVSSDKDVSSRLSTPELPRLIPSTKLGYTIH